MKYCIVADDSAAMRKVMRGMLTELGFEVGEAANGLEALESCRARRPDILLLDWNMPVMDGFACLAALRGQEGAEHPKIIFCTTGAEAAPIIRAMAGGASEYLVKPFDRDLLAQKVQAIGFA